jgi:FdhD protein
VKQSLNLDKTTDGYVDVTVSRLENGQCTERLDHVAQEVAVAMSYNGINHAVMLASPLDLEDFARGFSITEGIVDSAQQIYDIELKSTDQGWQLELDVASECFARLKEKRRHLTGRTGCGLCGTESLEQVLRPLKSVHKHAPITASVIDRALNTLPHFQRIQSLTGATHAAAWFDQTGTMRIIREDVGRHNALDKLIGAGIVLTGEDQHAWQNASGFIVVTSRASMEMVQKTVAAGFSVLVAVSAPTQLAIEIAVRYGLAMVGFARPGRWSIYAGAEYIDTFN